MLELKNHFIYSKRGDLQAAIHHLDIALMLEPVNSDAVVNLASLWTRLRQFDKAKSYHQRALEMRPTNSDVLNNYGVFLMKTGEYKTFKDIKCFKRFCLELNESPIVLFFYGVILMKTGE